MNSGPLLATWREPAIVGSRLESAENPTSCQRALLVTRRQPSRQAQRICDRCEVTDMAVDGVKAEAHGDHREVRAACLAPGIDLGREIARGVLRAYDILRAELLDRPAEAPHAVAQPSPGVDGVVDVPADEYEAVRETRGSIVCRLGGSTEPDRDGPRRFGYERGAVDPIEPAGEVDDVFCEEPAE